MNKKEITEIRKQFRPEYDCIKRIAGCYVDGDKNKVLSFKKNPAELPEEELFKYLDIFKNALSGKIGGKLFNLNFPLEQEREDGTQNNFYTLLKSNMDDNMLETFYNACQECSCL